MLCVCYRLLLWLFAQILVNVNVIGFVTIIVKVIAHAVFNVIVKIIGKVLDTAMCDVRFYCSCYVLL